MNLINSLLGNKNRLINNVIVFCILSSLIFSIRLNSIFLIALSIYVLISNAKILKIQFVKNKFILASASYFCLFLFSYFFSENKVEAGKMLERNLSLLFLPTILYFFTIGNKVRIHDLLRVFVWIITIAAALAITLAITKNIQFNIENNLPIHKAKSWFFTYHYLAGNVNISAIYLSLFIGFTINILFYDLITKKYMLVTSSKLAIILILFLSIILILLFARSALFISLLCIELVALRFSLKKKRIILFILLNLLLITMLIILIYSNDVLWLRFSNAFKPLSEISYFSGGLSLRLEQWKAIFNEFSLLQLFFGVGIGDVDLFYSNAYDSSSLSVALKRNFNSHNVIIESIVNVGVIGLSILVYFFAIAFKAAIQKKDVLYIIFLVIFIFSGFTESLLNRQYGLIFFVFFNTLFYFSNTTNNKNENSHIRYKRGSE